MSESETVHGTEEHRVEVSEQKSGLDLFAEGTPAVKRRRYWLHFVVYAVLLSFTVWPVFEPFNRVTPYVLGLPFNMFWDSFVLALVAVNTYFLYRVDEGPLLAGNDSDGGG